MGNNNIQILEVIDDLGRWCRIPPISRVAYSDGLETCLLVSAWGPLYVRCSRNRPMVRLNPWAKQSLCFAWNRKWCTVSPISRVAYSGCLETCLFDDLRGGLYAPYSGKMALWRSKSVSRHIAHCLHSTRGGTVWSIFRVFFLLSLKTFLLGPNWGSSYGPYSAKEHSRRSKFDPKLPVCSMWFGGMC